MKPSKEEIRRYNNENGENGVDILIETHTHYIYIYIYRERERK
jgi:hypothetical protein